MTTQCRPKVSPLAVRPLAALPAAVLAVQLTVQLTVTVQLAAVLAAVPAAVIAAVLVALPVGVLAALLVGCGASVDMASGGDPARATMTVPYTNVREEVRLYPDYGPIGASILAADGAAKDDKRPAAPKKGKP